MQVTVNGSVPKYYPDNNVLFDDDFNDGFNGWVPLWDVNVGPRGNLSLNSLSASGRHSLMLATGDKQNNEHGGRCMALKRMSRVKGGIFNFEAWLGMGTPKDTGFTKTPRSIEFGVDSMNQNAERRFLTVRYWNYDEASDTNKKKWQTYNGTSWDDIPGATVELPFNENKPVFIYVRLAVNIDTFKFHELQVLDQKYDISQNPVPALLTNNDKFKGGLNGTIEIVNPSFGLTDNATYLLVDRARGYFS